MAFKKGETPEGAKVFKPGESGNPKGRPIGAKGRATVLKKWIELNTTIKNPETGKNQKGTIEDKIAMAIIAKALKGDVSAYKEINDSVYGRATQSTEVIQTNVNYSADVTQKEAIAIMDAIKARIT